MNTSNTNCQNCKHDFTIEPEDFEFYEKINVPAPTFCPECRLQRRIMFRNERTLYKRTCDLTGQSMVTIFAPEKPIKVYHSKAWWSDDWDPQQYGMDYDPTRPFFEQFRELQMKTPWMNLIVGNDLVNSEYINHASNCKDSYLIFNADGDENVLYASSVISTKDSMDVYMSTNSELCYETISAGKSRVFFSEMCEECMEVYYKYLDTEDIDVEEQINPEISSGIYLMLFLSDIVFFFTANFTDFIKESLLFNSSFLLFDDFIRITLGLFNKITNNPFNLFSFSLLKRRFIEIECQKTSYSIKDKFNHYGISLLFYYSFFENRKPLLIYNDFNESNICLQKSFVPLISSKEVIINTLIDIFYSFIHLERVNEHPFVQEKNCIIYESFMKKKDFITKNHSLLNTKLKENFLLELLLSNDDKFNPIVDLLYSNDKKSLYSIILNIEAYENVCKLLTRIQTCKIISKSLYSLEDNEVTALFNTFIIKDFIKDDKILLSLIDVFGIKNSKKAFVHFTSKGIDELISSLTDKDIANQINKRKDKLNQLINKINF